MIRRARFPLLMVVLVVALIVPLERTVSAFSARLRIGVDMEMVTLDLATTVDSTVAPTSLGVWLRPRGGAR